MEIDCKSEITTVSLCLVEFDLAWLGFDLICFSFI